MSNTFEIIFLIVLLFLSAFFSAAEVAFLTSDKIKLKEMANKGISYAQKVLKLRLDRENTLTAILLLNNIVNIAATVVATMIGTSIAKNNGLSEVMVGTWVTIIMTFIIVVFAEMLPKTVGSRVPISIAKFSLVPMQLFFFLVFVPVWLFRKLSEGILWVLHLKPDPNQTSIVTEEELEAMINISHQEGIIPTEERVMIEKVFEFGDTTVYDIMVPRVDMVTLPNTVTLNQLSKFILDSGHSRIPIYKDTPDNIIGILHVKDLIPMLSSRSKKELNMEEIIREPYFIPDTKHISEVFKDMRLKRIHLAIVVDEYGGVSGLLTLEDLLEELVGEIQDEYDEEEEQVKKINGNTYILAADMSIDEVNTALDMEISGENFDTLAGFMVDRLGHLGKTGEKVETEEYTFVIDQVKKWRILKVKAIIHNKNQKDSR